MTSYADNAIREAGRAEALNDLLNAYIEADERGEFGECCKAPCPACNFGQWLDTYVMTATTAKPVS
jgi:hypothetical protein